MMTKKTKMVSILNPYYMRNRKVILPSCQQYEHVQPLDVVCADELRVLLPFGSVLGQTSLMQL